MGAQQNRDRVQLLTVLFHRRPQTLAEQRLGNVRAAETKALRLGIIHLNLDRWYAEVDIVTHVYRAGNLLEYGKQLLGGGNALTIIVVIDPQLDRRLARRPLTQSGSYHIQLRPLRRHALTHPMLQRGGISQRTGVDHQPGTVRRLRIAVEVVIETRAGSTHEAMHRQYTRLRHQFPFQQGRHLGGIALIRPLRHEQLDHQLRPVGIGEELQLDQRSQRQTQCNHPGAQQQHALRRALTEPRQS